ncbi:MAG TPA: GGDEF domain-containing protein [Candidatus Acidoferrales bacterium]|nr:GGDEF domain-containing protein [Candidatus Acidoferrales bacterium]
MRDQALVWNTDTSLRVTSLTARLRGFAGLGERSAVIHVSDLWGDPVPLIAHQWALGGETLAFEATVRGTQLAFAVEPLLDPDGSIAGVTGRAVDLGSETPDWRCEGRRCTVLYLDLDRFRSINDVYGHGFGELVLTAVAERLARHVRGYDSVTRVGRDAFAIVLDAVCADDAAAEAAHKILRCFDDPLEVEGLAIRVSASIGVAVNPDPNASPASVLAAAEGEMRAVKRNGGNGIKLASAWQARSSPVPSRFAIRESA